MKSDPAIGQIEETGDRGVPALAVQKTTGAGLSSDGKYVPLQTDSSGNLRVNLAAGTSGTEYADGAARGTATGTLAMGDDGTNIQSVAVTSAGVVKVDVSATAANSTAIKVDGSAVTQPVSGTVTVTQATAANLNAAVVGTLSTNGGSPSSTNVGALTARAQAAAPSFTEGRQVLLRTNLAGALVITHDSTNEPVNISQMNGVTVSMGAGATGTGVQRIVQANDSGRTLVSTGGSASSSGNNTLVAAGTNKLKVYAFSLSTLSTSSVTCIFQSGAGGTELWRVVLQAVSGANTGANLCVTPPAYLFATAAATLLNLNLSSAQTVHWSVAYYDEA